MTQLFYEVTTGGVRQDCPHTEEQVSMFMETVTENIGDAVVDNHLAPLVVSRATSGQTIEYSTLFMTEFTEPLEPDVIDDALEAIADSWDKRYPGVI